MKICVTAQQENLDALVDPRFGRASYFLVVDTDSLEYEALVNLNKDSSGGVGIQSAQVMAQKNITCVITGNIGPNASQTLDAAGIAYCLGATGTVREAIQDFKDGKLRPSSGPNVSAKSGM